MKVVVYLLKSLLLFQIIGKRSVDIKPAIRTAYVHMQLSATYLSTNYSTVL
jgi:hypothetical protein